MVTSGKANMENTGDPSKQDLHPPPHFPPSPVLVLGMPLREAEQGAWYLGRRVFMPGSTLGLTSPTPLPPQSWACLQSAGVKSPQELTADFSDVRFARVLDADARS